MLRRPRSCCTFSTNVTPNSQSIDPKKVAQFLKDRKRYKDDVQEKKNEIPTLSAIDRDILESLHFLGHFDTLALDVDVDDLMSDHIKECVEGFIKD